VKSVTVGEKFQLAVDQSFTVKRFDYTPGEIKLKKGVPVVLEFTSKDIVMGFNVPDLGARSDTIPGVVTRDCCPTKSGRSSFTAISSAVRVTRT
jgi:heme/copper-type cytochrome/quinol oxidase subunit 2